MRLWTASVRKMLKPSTGLMGLLLVGGCQSLSVNPSALTPEQTANTPGNRPEAVADASTTQVAPLRINQPAPAFSGVDSDGKIHNLSDFLGKTVVLEWTNHQCPFTNKHYGSGNMQTLQAEATQQGVIWLSIISSAPGQSGHVMPDQANELTTLREAQPTAVILDPEGTIGQRYSARTTPHMYVIDPEGKLRYMGGIDSIPSADPADIDDATNYVQAALINLKAGQPVDPEVTPPYGCSIKYS